MNARNETIGIGDDDCWEGDPKYLQACPNTEQVRSFICTVFLNFLACKSKHLVDDSKLHQDLLCYDFET